jgi:hypothetical protein
VPSCVKHRDKTVKRTRNNIWKCGRRAIIHHDVTYQYVAAADSIEYLELRGSTLIVRLTERNLLKANRTHPNQVAGA